MSGFMPPGWTAHQTPEGRWYYAHQPSGTTQWQPPAPQGQAHAPSQPHQQPHQQHVNSAHASSGPVAVSTPTASRFTFPQPIEFKLQEKALSLSGDSFKIKRLDTGEPFFKVKGNALSLKDSKTLLDMNGNALYKMSESILSLRGRMQIIDPSTKQPVVTLRKKGFIPMMGTSTIQAWRGATDEGDAWIEVKGDFFRKDFQVREKATGRVIATIKRKSMNLSNILLEKDTYVIRVEPGADAALLVFFVIAADEQYRDDGERRGYSSLF